VREHPWYDHFQPQGWPSMALVMTLELPAAAEIEYKRAGPFRTRS
jgi:hypothetical protein